MAVIATKMTTIDKIEVELGKVKNKTAAARYLSKVFDPKPSSIINHWFGKLSIPEAEQDNVLSEIKKYRKTEK